MEKSHVSMEAKLCPVCAKQHTFGCGILLDRRLRKSMERETVTGWGMCEEHDRMRRDGYVALIEVNAAKSDNPMTLEGVWRTGTFAHIRKEVFQSIFGEEAIKPIAFTEPEVMVKLTQMANLAYNAASPE